MAEASTTKTPAPPQHIRALSRANEVRLARALLKRRLRSGALTVREVVERRPQEADGMTLLNLLESQQRWGTYRCGKFLEQYDLPDNRSLEKLTERQRNVLVAALREREAAVQTTASPAGASV